MSLRNPHTDPFPLSKQHLPLLLSGPVLPACLLAGFVALQFPQLGWLMVAIAAFLLRFPDYFHAMTAHPVFQRLGGWRTTGVVLGTVLFAGILVQADPAVAQLFDQVESQADSIFGQYIDQSIITFLFGLLRIVVWVSAVGFVFFAVYQAQRGEQWQPLLQNAFIIIAAVVVVEGLSALFFGGQ
ncbi:MAG: hypothetical protein ACFB8W_05540 [Elainellaceae cyanobacterium]